MKASGNIAGNDIFSPHREESFRRGAVSFLKLLCGREALFSTKRTSKEK